MKELELLRMAAPEAVLTVTLLATLALQMVGGQRCNGRGACGAAAAVGLVLALLVTAALPAQGALYGGMLVSNPLNTLFKMVCLGLALLTVPAVRVACPRRHAGEFFALLLLATIGLLLLVGSEELLMIFIGLELTGLSLYLLAAFDKANPRSSEAGLKYFLFGSTASAFTLYGMSLLYGACGALGLEHIGRAIGAGALTPLFAAGLVMTLIGFAFKLAAAPFHLWAPDVYQGAPVPAAAFIASASKVASLVVLGKILLIAFGPVASKWSVLITVLAAVSIVIGNLVALAQGNVRRLLAYSAVAHTGYTLMGLVGGGAGFGTALFYSATYAAAVLGAFAVVAQVRAAAGGATLSHFSGLRARSPLLAGCMTVFLLSLAGLPPLAGFFGKLYVFAAALRQPHMLWLVVLALAGSLVSLYYYLAVLREVLVEEPPEQGGPIRIDFGFGVALLMLAIIVIALGIFPDALVAWIESSLAATNWF